jgi:outer membrane protein OmpA-like peptidoglycan-associated protein
MTDRYLQQRGRWFREGSNIVVLVDDNLNRPLGDESFEVSTDVSSLSRAALIHPRIDFHAQEALYRMSRGNAAARASAGGMLAAVQTGELEGIYIVNQAKPAIRARKMNLGWWEIMPGNQDAILLLDPTAPGSGSPMVAFRDGVKSDPARLDAALHLAWTTFRFIREGRASQCPSFGGIVLAETGSLEQLKTVVPPIFCAKSEVAGIFSPTSANGCRYEVDEKSKSKTSPGAVASLFLGPTLLESALLFDFAVGSSTTKPTHDDYFKRIIAENDLRNPKSKVRVALIEGFTDCVDTEAVNAPLRFQRAESVAVRLSQLGLHPGNLGLFRGATIGENPGDDSTRLGRARNRSVTVLLELRPATPPAPRPKPKPGASVCPGSTQFSVRLLGSVGLSKPGGVGPAIGQLEFEIVDHQCNRGQTFVLDSAGASAGTPSIAIEPSDEKFFVTDRPLLFRDFEGLGLWESIIAQFGLGPSFDGIAIPHLIMSWFGWSGGLGAGASVVTGVVSRSGKERATGSGSIPHDPTR